jgi:hypothetical protein
MPIVIRYFSLCFVILGSVLSLVACGGEEIKDSSQVTNSTAISCGVDCQMTKKSGIPGVLIPKNSVMSKTELGSLTYTSPEVSVLEVSRFYMDSLGSAGWKFQPDEGGTNETKSKTMVWCRNNPSVLNLLISVSSLADNFQEPGVNVLLMTDTIDDLPCS